MRGYTRLRRGAIHGPSPQRLHYAGWIRESLNDLNAFPIGRGVCCHVEVKNATTGMLQDNEAEQHSERGSGDEEEVVLL